MKRRYTRELFAQRVVKIRSLMPKAYIGVDYIVGINGETEEMFEDAYYFLQALDFSQLHVFSYSERPNTRALKYTPKNTPQVKKERSQRLIDLSEQKYSAFCASSIGNSLPVIFEEQPKGDRMYGYTENYIRVSTIYNNDWIGEILDFKLTKESIVL